MTPPPLQGPARDLTRGFLAAAKWRATSLAMTAPTASRFAILLDGALTPTDRLRVQLAGRRVFAADGGIRNADALGVEPELWLGDFDSSDPALLERHASVAREGYPGEKSVSDGRLAIDRALEQGARDILLVGALGGPRSDHALFNLTAAVALACERPDLEIAMCSGREEALPLVPERSLKPDWPAGTVFSVVGLTALEGLTVRDAKWPLDCVKVPFGSTWTLSNVAGEHVEILLFSGCGVAIRQLDVPAEKV